MLLIRNNSLSWPRLTITAGTASRITYLCPNDVHSVISQWSAWMSGCIAVPLSVSHPPELLEYFIKDSQSNLIITTPELEERLKPLAGKLDIPSITIDHRQLTEASLTIADEDSFAAGFLSGEFYKKSPAMVCSPIIYYCKLSYIFVTSPDLDRVYLRHNFSPQRSGFDAFEPWSSGYQSPQCLEYHFIRHNSSHFAASPCSRRN